MPRIIRDQTRLAKPTDPATTQVFQSNAEITTYEWAAIKRGVASPNPSEKETVRRRRWRRKAEDAGYNSEDEYFRPKVTAVDDQVVKVG